MELREVKQQFFALRNGLLADMLRKQCGLTQKMVFGLNLPQLRQIADAAGCDPMLADALWADAEVRESRLLAPMVADPAPRRLRWLAEVRTVEEADVLCHRLLRRVAGAELEAARALTSPLPLRRYAGLRLLMNLRPATDAALRQAVESMPRHPLTDGIVSQIKLDLQEDVDSL